MPEAEICESRTITFSADPYGRNSCLGRRFHYLASNGKRDVGLFSVTLMDNCRTFRNRTYHRSVDAFPSY